MKPQASDMGAARGGAGVDLSKARRGASQRENIVAEGARGCGGAMPVVVVRPGRPAAPRHAETAAHLDERAPPRHATPHTHVFRELQVGAERKEEVVTRGT